MGPYHNFNYFTKKRLIPNLGFSLAEMIKLYFRLFYINSKIFNNSRVPMSLLTFCKASIQQTHFRWSDLFRAIKLSWDLLEISYKSP